MVYSKQGNKRTPRGYDGSKTTTHHVSSLVSLALAGIGESYQERPDLVLAAWPAVVGQQFAGMTHAVSLVDGVLVVKVMNSTLHSVLSLYEKTRILNHLRQRFPKTQINNIIFRIG